MRFLHIDERSTVFPLLTLRWGRLLSFLFVMTLFCETAAFAAPTSVEISILGVKGAVKDNVVAALALPPGIVRDNRVYQRWLMRFVDHIPELVETALQPFGYYRSDIEVALKEQAESYLIEVQIVTPDPIRIRYVDLWLVGSGVEEKKLIKEREYFPQQEGDVLNHKAYEEGKKSLRQEAINLGYLKAEFKKSKVMVHVDEGAADIEIELVTGPRYKFGTVTIEGGDDRFDDEFLRRFISFDKGDFFSHKELHRSRINFYQSSRFKEVLMEPLIDEAEGLEVPIRVTLVTGKQQHWRVGVGYGTNTGARLTLNYENTQVSEYPHVFNFDALIAENTQLAEARYTIPRPGHVENKIINRYGVLREDVDAYDTKIFYTELESRYGINNDTIGSAFVRYSVEDSEVGEDDNLTHLLTPGLRFSYRSYDDLINPRSGYQLRMEVRGSFDELISDTTFSQVIAGGSFMWPLGKRFTMHSRVEGATTFNKDDFSEIPASMRFFVGGNNSVRGYDYKSRGPEDENGDVIGGDSLLVGSLECEYALTDDWGLAVFYDIGSAFDAGDDDLDFDSGAGIGARRYTLIGPIKIDLATRVSESTNKVTLHLSVGFDI
jgi:translocation and assembly module TamA